MEAMRKQERREWRAKRKAAQEAKRRQEEAQEQAREQAMQWATQMLAVGVIVNALFLMKGAQHGFPSGPVVDSTTSFSEKLVSTVTGLVPVAGTSHDLHWSTVLLCFINTDAGGI